MHYIDNELKLMLEGKFEESKEISDKLEKLGPEGIPNTKGELGDPEMWIRHCFNRGWFKIQEGKYQEGSQLLESGRFINVYGSPPLKTDAPIFNPEIHDLKGKSIIISLEGGLGDEIIHARFAQSYKNLGAKNVYLAASPELVSAFERVPGVDRVILRNQAHFVSHDYWVPGFSAGWIAGHSFENFPNDPYISPKEESVEIWKQVIRSDKIKVGIRWAGNPKFEHQQFRRFPPEFLTELTKYEDVQLYSLQRDQNIIDLPPDIYDLQHLLISWEDTLAAIANLDLIITSCTSVAHAAAAMGKETWVLTPLLPYHTWTYGAPYTNYSPYYKSVKIYRQEKPNKWNETFQKLYKDFEEKFELGYIEHDNHDKEHKRLNLGCGFLKLEGYTNVDYSDIYEPDVKMDLNQLPWGFNDGEFQHIVAKDILEHLGNEKVSFVDIMKELYRVSDNGAVWEVQVPHHRCDNAVDDPTHVRVISPGMFRMFDQKFAMNKIKNGDSTTPLSITEGIDIDICEVKYHYINHWIEKLHRKEIDEEQLEFALNTYSNVAESTIMLLQVHKPPRHTIEEMKREVRERNEE